MKYWINVVAKDHALAGIAAGFVQAQGNKAAQLAALEQGDVVFFYSPGTLFRRGEVLQAFTAVARVADAGLYTVQRSPASQDTQAVRRSVVALASEEAPAAALAPALDFIADKANWATTLRRSLFDIGEADAHRIAAAMKADLTA